VGSRWSKRATADFVVKGGQQSVKPTLTNKDLGSQRQRCHARGNSYPLVHLLDICEEIGARDRTITPIE